MNNSITDITIVDPFQSGHQDIYYDLRWRVLRQPWNQPKGTEKDDLEKDSLHRLAISSQNEAMACARLHLNHAREAQIRYMAVGPAHRKSGIGRMLILELEQLATDAGVEKIILQAREEAVPFYQHCGYEIVMETFLLYGQIRHFLMEKVLV